MANYLLILIWPAVVAISANMFNGKYSENICGKPSVRYKWIWAIIAIIPLIIWTANRPDIIDTGSYKYAFRNMPTEFSEISSYMVNVSKDELFYYTSALIKVFITESDIVYFGIIAAFQAFALIFVYRKYSESMCMSLFLFFISSDYVSWMFNGIRQFTAVCLTFLCFGLILKKRYVPAIIIIALASFFHGTAWIVIPFLFIAQGKAWNKKTLAFMFGVIFAVLFIDQFTDILDGLLVDTQYTNVVSDWQQSDDDGTNIIRVLVYSIPAILSLYGKRKIDEADDPIINIATNMSIASAGIYIVSMFTSGIFIGRLPIYFSLYGYILLPWEINHLFKKDMAKLVTVIMIVFYAIFYIYNLKFGLGVI